jgi:WD40 repeat protein
MAYATGSDDGSCKLFDFRSTTPLAIYSLPAVRGITSVAVSPSGQRILAAADAQLFSWSVLSPGEPAQLLRVPHENRVSAIVLSPDGQALATSSWDALVRVCGL